MIELLANTGRRLHRRSFPPLRRRERTSRLFARAVADLDGIVIHAPDRGRAIAAEAFGSSTCGERPCCVHTRWDRHWRTERYGKGYPSSRRLRHGISWTAGAARVASTPSTSMTTATARDHIHTALLAAGIPIVEHLCGLDRRPIRVPVSSRPSPRVRGSAASRYASVRAHREVICPPARPPSP